LSNNGDLKARVATARSYHDRHVAARPIGFIAKFETTGLTRLKLLLATAAKPLSDITIVLTIPTHGAETMKTIYAIAMTAAVLISAAAGAGTTVTTSSTRCKPSAYGPETCTTTTTKNDDADQGSQGSSTPRQKSAAEARKEQQEADARDRRWEAFCKPTGVVDKFGVTRLQYAHRGCEFGISEDIESFAQMK